MRWSDKIALRNEGKEANPAWWVNDKAKLHDFCSNHGLPMPEILALWSVPEEMNLEHLPKRFVLKPTVMFSTWGVMLLERQEDGSFYEDFRGRTLTTDQILEIQIHAYNKCQYKDAYQLMAEERVESVRADENVPCDYKFSMFDGEIGLIQQINQNTTPEGYAFMDANFEPLDIEANFVSDWTGKPLFEPWKPNDPIAMAEIAVKASKLLNSPFMRIDMYEGVNGPVIGEMTPSPGDAFYGNYYRYSESLEEKLGAMWLAAEERISARN